MEMVVQPQQWDLVCAGRSELRMMIGGQQGLGGLGCSFTEGFQRAGLRLVR